MPVENLEALLAAHKLDGHWAQIQHLVKRQKIVSEASLTLLECQLELLFPAGGELTETNVDFTLMHPPPHRFVKLEPENLVEFDVLEKYKNDSTDLVEIVTLKHSLVVICKLLFYLGKHQACFNIANSLKFKGVNLEAIRAVPPYSKFLLLQVLTFALISGQNKDDIAALGFEMFSTSFLFDELVKFKEPARFLSFFISELVRYMLENRRPFDALKLCREYMQFLSHTPLEFDFYTRISICSTLVDLLLMYRNARYEVPRLINAETVVVSPLNVYEEVNIVLSLYEYLVQEFVPFPRAGQTSLVTSRLYTQISSVYSVFCPAEECSSDLSLQSVGVVSSWEEYLESMYRATRKTYRSRTIMRRLGFAALLLESVDEARNAFKVYFEKDLKSKSRSEWWKSVCHDPSESPEAESFVDVLAVNIGLVKACLDSYQTQNALNYAEKAVSMCKDNPELGKVMFPLAYYYLGICYARFGLETLEHDHFCNLQDQAHIMLREAERFDLENWKIHYRIALQAAEMGHPKLASDHIKLVLKANPMHVASWHLLTLITLAKTDSETEWHIVSKAREVYTTCLEFMFSGREVSSTDEPDTIIRTVSKFHADEWINFKLTKLLLDETISQCSLSQNTNVSNNEESPKATPFLELLGQYKEMFEMYKRVYFPESKSLPAENQPLFSASSTPEPQLSVMPEIEKYLVGGANFPIASMYPVFLQVGDFYAPTSSDPEVPLRRLENIRKRKLRYIEIWLQLAQLFRNARKYEDARSACDEVQKIARGNADTEVELGLICLEDAEIAIFDASSFSNDSNATPVDDPRILSATRHFQSALSYDDSHLLARSWLGRCYLILGKIELARAELEKAVKGGRNRGSKVWIACYQLGTIYLKLGDYDKAHAYLASASQRQSTSILFASFRGYEVLPQYI